MLASRTPGEPAGQDPARPRRSYTADELGRDQAIAKADTVLLTVPNQLGVDCKAHVVEGS